jgi:hypothetical protein
MSREAMKLALEALVFAQYEDEDYDDVCDQKVREARNALRQALAQPEQEPIAWMHTTGTGHVYFRKKPQDKVFNPQPVYTAPPKAAEWVGLTDEEISEIEDEYIVDYRIPAGSAWNFAKDLEAKLKEKNGG